MPKLKTREPSGRPQREREFPPTQVRRLRDAALAGLRDPQWGAELGRLYLTQVIGEAGYAAGVRWAREAAEYHAVIGVRPTRSPAMEIGSIGHEPDPDSQRGRDVAASEGKIIYANKAFRKLTGHDPAAVIGQSPRILQGPGTDTKVIARLSKALKTRGIFEGKAVNYKKDGTPFIMYWRVLPIKVGKTVTAWMAIQREGSFV